MRVLLDSSVPAQPPALTAAGHEIERVADWIRDPGDEAILTPILVLPVAAIACGLAAMVGSWSDALSSAAFVGLAAFLLSELVAVTIRFMPFTRPYEAGHAKLKTRWSLFLIGVYLFGHVLVRFENAYSTEATSFALLLLGLTISAAAVDAVGQARARRSPAIPVEDLSPDEGRIAALDVAVFDRTHVQQ